MSRAKAQGESTPDWARTPSALFAAGILGLASLTTLGIALSRDLQRQPAPVSALSGAESELASGLQAQPQRTELPARAVRLIDVNRADLGELDLLPGIGPALGQRIIDYRTEHGPFASVDDLTKVSGIGPRTLDRLRPLVTLGEGGYTTDN